ncbi:L-aspartate--glyoxylate aminotransferase BhcA [Salinisphaera sp.]|uniref:L-aspartate--glyoxylate aminotransferase BhcA n=1 Tax=Salinisphaera sp. TaxID=1914330 RepID=UPI002D772DA5|nr:L-aspartate--glyoxylate aminotransferase BhcA [Salinisphaera sp.]HET7315648.1 aminotransferase class V-fold PLP-dependent enzyme [Salinisphaera sp.]
MPTQNPVFIPGPTNIPDRLRHAMDMQSIDHRAPDFERHFVPLLQSLKSIFGTSVGEVFLFPSTGTGGWEAAVTNTLSPGDEVLAGRYGMFSHRWIELCRRQDLYVHAVEADWGEGVPVAEYERILAADTEHRIKAVLVCHNETATGVTSDVGAVRKALDQTHHPAMLFVDGVSSIASIDFRMDEWGVDVAVTGSQKGLMLTPGLAVLAFSPKALEACHASRCTRAYFDMRAMREANRAGSFPYTPPVGLIRGLAESMSMLKDEGLPQVFARHRRIAEGVRRAVDAWGLSLCAKRPELYSNTVSAVQVPRGYDSGLLVRHAYEHYGVSFGGGLGDVAGKVFRIGHLGDMTDVMALSGLAAAEMAMANLDYPIEMGSGVAAAQAYYSATRNRWKQEVA